MRVAFVGVKRKYQELSPEYRDFFNQYHLELPYYYAKHGSNDITITTVDYLSEWKQLDGGGSLRCEPESDFIRSNEKYDVVVHWRKWFPEMYKPDAINVINCQDHSFGQEWKIAVRKALVDRQLYGILCFPTWHKENLNLETGISRDRLLDGVTLGVDTDIYTPSEKKDPFQMLWASDPGRGLDGAMNLAIRLWQRDKRFRLHICYPDYVQGMPSLNHPAVEFHGNVPNGPKLWELFNSTGILPYTSTFHEPSSRAHRQAQAAGSLVVYPPRMGSPSELIQSGQNGVVIEAGQWLEQIARLAGTDEHARIGRTAREFAVSENWAVQAGRFNRLFERILGEKR